MTAVGNLHIHRDPNKVFRLGGRIIAAHTVGTGSLTVRVNVKKWQRENPGKDSESAGYEALKDQFLFL